MVNPRKPHLAPAPVSRANSSQPLARSANKKSPNGDSAGPGPSTKPPAKSAPNGQNSTLSTSQLSQTQAKSLKAKKAMKKATTRAKQGGFLHHVFRLFLVFLAAYVMTVCPKDDQLSSPICQSLALWKVHVLEPYIIPPLSKALHHPTVEPYFAQAQAIHQRAEPYVKAAYSRADPVVRKTSRILWNNVIAPVYDKVVIGQIYPLVYPTFRKHYAKVEPYVNEIHAQTSSARHRLTYITHRVYITTRPHVQKLYAVAKPYVAQAYVAGKPVVVSLSRKTSARIVTTYHATGPYRQLLYLRARRQWRRARRQLIALKKTYVDKHVGQIWEKVEELSGSKSETTPPPQSLSRHVKPTTETAAEAPSPTPSATPATSSFVEATTEGSSSSPAAPSPEETPAVASTAATSSQHTAAGMYAAAASVSASDVPLPPADADPTDASASSIMLETLSPHTTSEVTETITPSAAALAEEENDDDLLSDLGLEDEPAQESEPAATVPVDSTPSQTPLTAEEKKQITADKRQKIVARHDEWMEKLKKTVAEKKVEVREMLVSYRKAFVGALWDKAVPPTNSPSDKLFSEDDLAGIRFPGDYRISFVLEDYEAEGERLLKGLDAYLRKEAKAGTPKSLAEQKTKLDRWSKVLGKIRDKHASLTEEVRLKVQQWFIGVRDIEIRDCLAAATEVKKMADRSQTDLAMDYAWLDDVTHMDWSYYHQLMDQYEEFDTDVRLMQNGSHPVQVADPVMAALDKLQGDMAIVTTAWESQAKAVDTRAQEEIFTLPVVPTSDTKEPEVSILPIEPNVGEAEVDGEQILIGKSAEQVAQQLKDIPLVHEEL